MPHLTLIYPAWPKLPEQTEFHLPPHGPVCLAAAIPEEYNICFIDENVDTLDLEAGTDLVLLSMMLTCQLPRGFEIAAMYRERGVRVIAGGISAMLHAEEVAEHVDSLFLGEVEDGRLAKVLADWEKGCLKPIYSHVPQHISEAENSVLAPLIT
jgi:hypothetical protein